MMTKMVSTLMVLTGIAYDEGRRQGAGSRYALCGVRCSTRDPAAPCFHFGNVCCFSAGHRIQHRRHVAFATTQGKTRACEDLVEQGRKAITIHET